MDDRSEGGGERTTSDFNELSHLINAHLSDEDRDQVSMKLRDKNQLRRFKVSVEILAQFLDEGLALVRGTEDQRIQAWRRCVAWVEELWTAAVELWKSGHNSVAVALSITTIEESGKLAAERFRLLGVNGINLGPDGMRAWRCRQRPFRDHFTKHVLAATAGASINARIDRVLGIQFVNAFLDAAENQRLETFRQRCLYLDHAGGLHIPSATVTRDNAAKYVALAGELFAELIPMPDEWSRVLDQVKEFEQVAGIPYE